MKNNKFLGKPECLPVLKVYPDYYRKVGFNKPWIGYFASIDGEEIVSVLQVIKESPKTAKLR